MNEEELKRLHGMLKTYRSDLVAARRKHYKRGTVHYRQMAQDIAEVDAVISLLEVEIGEDQ